MMNRRPSLSQRTRIRSCVRALCLLSITTTLHAQRLSVHTCAAETLPAISAVDLGQLPVSEPLSLTIRLKPSAAQTAALDHLLAAQTDPTSPSYHHWITPQQFADQFSPSEDQLSRLTSWLSSQGLTIASTSPSHSRLTVTGTAGQAQLAFRTTLHRFNVSGTPFFANASEPTMPVDLAPLVAGISGLDDLPQPASARIAIGSAAPAHAATARLSSLQTVPSVSAAGQTDSLTTIADAIDANVLATLPITSAACSSDLTTSEYESFRALFRQAAAQGITVVASSACASSSASGFPASLAEVTSLTVHPRESAVPSPGVDARPEWQAAPGLPQDALRHEPDLAANSLTAFTDAIATLNQQTGNRLGNINPTLYALAKTPGLFTQPDAAPGSPALGNWEPATGLGLIDLNTLLKVYPRGSYTTTIDFQSSSYTVNYGTPFTLRAVVNSSGFTAAGPTGTVIFTASGQGVLGSAPVNGGTATLDSGLLPVGSYTIIATYSGDANYAPSSKGDVTIAVNIVNATLAAVLSPSTSVPYGAIATAIATVTLPGSPAAPNGDVSAQVVDVTGTASNAMLSPNPGGNTATANVVLSMPSPGSYTVQVTCQGNQNFLCQTPVSLPIKTVKGSTKTSITLNPSAPHAGQPVYITASVANAGNGTGTYTYGGSIGFYDSGKLVANAPVATNQATATLMLSGTRTHTFTAIYSGETNWNTSTSGAVAVYPTMIPDAISISTNTNGFNSLAGVNIVFTAAVTTATNYGSGPTGWVTFFDTYNGAVLQLGFGSVLVANGPNGAIATFTTTGLLPGLHHIYAQYTGDDSYSALTSAVTTLSISDFNLTMNPATLNVSQGKSAQVNIVPGASGGFTGQISLSCSPPGSSEATCTVSPSSLSAGQSATLTITTTAARSINSGQQASAVRRGWAAVAGVSLAGCVFFVLAPRRRLTSLLLVLLAVGLTANLGCAIGSVSTTSPVTGSGPTPADPGTPLGTQNYIITAAGSDGLNTVRHTYQYQVTVQ